MPEKKSNYKNSRQAAMEERIRKAKRKAKIFKIAFFASEAILLLIVIACIIILKLLDGVKVIPLPELHTNEAASTTYIPETSVISDNGTTEYIELTQAVDLETDESYATPFAGEEYTTIVLYGLDGRGSIVSLTDSSNSDVIILISINNETGAVKLASVYRDTLMKLYPEKNVKQDYRKANFAMCEYGVLESINTLNMNLDLNIQHYICVNWACAVEIINALGGVDIEMKERYWECEDENNPGNKVVYMNGLISELVESTEVRSMAIPKEYFKDGEIWHADGIQAVAYMRLRKTDSDLDRTARQREVLTKIVEKAKNASVSELLDILDIVKKNMALSLDQSDLLGLIYNIGKYHIEGNTGYPTNLYGGGDYTDPNMNWSIIPINVVENVRYLHEFLYNQKSYTPSNTLEEISEEIRVLGLFDEDWNLTIETKSF